MSVVSDIEIRIRADIARLQQDMDAARGAVGNAMSDIQKAVGAAKAALAAFAAALAIKGIADFVNSTIEAAGGLHDMSIQTGASVAALMQFKTIAATSETSIDGIATMLNKLAKNMAVSSESSKGTGDAIKALGLNFETVRKMAPDQQLLTIAKALDGFRDGAGKSAVAITLFGKEGAKALPFLADLADAADEVSKSLTDQEVAAKAALAGMADDYGDNMTKIQLAGDQWKKQISLAILPALFELSQAFLDTANSTTGLKGEIGKLSTDGTITTWARNSVTAVSYIIDAFQILGRIASVITSAIGSTLGIIFSGLAAQFRALNQVAHGDVRDAFNTIKNQISLTGTVLSNFGDEVGAAFSDQTFGSKLRERIAQIQQLKNEAKPDKPQLDFKDHSVADAATAKEIAAYVALNAAVQERIKMNAAEIASGKPLTEAQKAMAKLDADVAAGKVKLSDAHLLALRSAMAEAAGQEEWIRAAKATRDAVQVLTDAQDASYASLAAETLANQQAVANFGLTKAAIEANTVARLQDQVARAGELGMSEAYVAQLQREIAVRQANAAALAQIDKLNAGTDVAKAKELLDILSAVDAAAKDAAAGMAASFGAVGTAIGGLTTALTGYARTQATVAAQLAEAKVDAKGDPIKIAAAESAAAQKSATAQIKQYGDLASAAKGFFKENSAGYKVMETTEKAFRAYQISQEIATMVTKSGILTAFTGLFAASKATEVAATVATVPVTVAAEGVKQTALATTAMAGAVAVPFPGNLVAFGIVAAMLAAIGLSGGGGGSAPSVSATRQSANGTGSVLGDSSEKSDSIAKSLKLVADNTYRGLSISTGMLTSLRAIQNSLSGLGNLITRTTGITGSLAADQNGAAQNLFNSILGNNSIGEKLTGGLLGKLVGGIFGGKVTTLDTGLTATRTTLGGAISGGINAGQYTDTKTSGGLFSSDKYRTAISSLGAEVNDQFTQVIKGLAGGITAAAGVLGVGGDAFTAKLNSFVVDLGKISLKDLTGEQIQAALEAAFSKLGDDMAKFAIGGLAQFQQVGEGAYETLVRIANDYASVDAVLSSFGKSFGSVGLASVAARENLIALSGGLEDFVSQGSYFLDNFFSDQEKAATLRSAVDARISPLNGGVEVTTIEQYKNLALAQDLTTESGQAAYATLMATAEAFKELVGYGNAAGKTLDDIASERKGLQDQIDALNTTSLQQRAKERASLDSSNRALYDQLQALNDLAAARSAETSALNDTISSTKAFAASLTTALSSLRQGALSTLTPIQKLADAQSSYQQTLAAAKAGDATAQGALAAAAQAYLAADQVVNASSSRYAADAAKVQSELAALAADAIGKQSAAEQQLAVLTAQADGILKVNDSVNAATTSIVAAIEALAATGYLDGSHAGGLSWVPKNGYRAELHYGEAVLTAEQNKAYRAGGAGTGRGDGAGAMSGAIAALTAEVAGLRADAAQHAGYVAETVARSGADNAQTVVAGGKAAAMSAYYAEQLAPALA